MSKPTPSRTTGLSRQWVGGRPFSIDLNADLGESYGRWTLGDDEAMCAVVTSANVACGFHAGDPADAARDVSNALSSTASSSAPRWAIPISSGFGRRFLDISPADLTAARHLPDRRTRRRWPRAEGGRVRYVKPHGALYNTAVEHEEQASAVVDAVVAVDPELPLLGLPDSALLRIAAETRPAPGRRSTSSTAATPPTAGWSTGAGPAP